MAPLPATPARGRATAVIPASLQFKAISKAFGDRKVIDNVSLTIKPAEVVCLLGPSGCGKTTLLRIAAGIEEPTSGELLMDDRVIANIASSLPTEKRGIGMVFQDYALFPHMTVLDNVAFGLRDMSKAEQKSAAEVAMSSVGLLPLAKSYPYMLSGGEQQRVALARAIVPRPRVLLMDEPFSNLDRRMRDVVREETVALLRETGATCIMVTHDPEEAMRIADRIVLLRDGRVIQEGPPEELYSAPVDIDVARFFCDLNEIACTVKNGMAQTQFGQIPVTGLPDGPATLCIRPQAFRLKPAGQGVAARIIGSRFLGEMYMVDLNVQGMDFPVQARVRERPEQKRGKDGGKDLGIEIDFDEVLVFSHQPA
ncbi:MAG: ABC transporter ATP-binding protein [Beijerinckiaceae bacterium]